MLHLSFTLAPDEDVSQPHDPARLLPRTGRLLPIDQEVVLQGL